MQGQKRISLDPCQPVRRRHRVSPPVRFSRFRLTSLFRWTSVARGAVLHAIQTKSKSTPSIVQIEARVSGESYGVGIGNGGPIHWLVRWVSISFMHALVKPLADYLLPRAMNSPPRAPTQGLFLQRQCVVLQSAAVFWTGIVSRGQV